MPLNESFPGADFPAGSKGIWQSETSSLIYDPSAPTDERWKLIWHQYLNANKISLFVDYGWIALKMAATPSELASATTVKLFAGAGLQADSSITTTPVFSPVASAPLIHLNTDITQSIASANVADLNLCIFAEPGLHATNSALYLTIYCADASSYPTSGNITERQTLFRCASPCNIGSSASWQYLGYPVTQAEAQSATGNHHFQALSIVKKYNKTFLIATPVDTSISDGRYNGCRVYEFSDIDNNELRRSNGDLLQLAEVSGEAGTHHGACDAYADLKGGILLSQFANPGTANAFSIYKSQQYLP